MRTIETSASLVAWVRKALTCMYALLARKRLRIPIIFTSILRWRNIQNQNGILGLTETCLVSDHLLWLSASFQPRLFGTQNVSDVTEQKKTSACEAAENEGLQPAGKCSGRTDWQMRSQEPGGQVNRWNWRISKQTSASSASNYLPQNKGDKKGAHPSIHPSIFQFFLPVTCFIGFWSLSQMSKRRSTYTLDSSLSQGHKKVKQPFASSLIRRPI